VEHSLRQDHRRLRSLPGRGLAAPHPQVRGLASLGPRMGPSRAAQGCSNRQWMCINCSRMLCRNMRSDTRAVIPRHMM